MKREYHFFSCPPDSAGIQIIGLGHFDGTKSRWPRYPRLARSYSLSFFNKGGATFHSIETGGHTFQRRDCLICFPGQSFILYPDNGVPWEEYWVLMQGPVMKILEKERIITPASPVFHLSRTAQVRRFFHQMLLIAAQRNPIALLRLPGLAYQLLNEVLLSRVTNPSVSHGTAPPVWKIMELIRAHPEKEWNYRQLARQHGVSYPLLHREFSRLFKIPPHRFLCLERMKMAAQRLTTGITVKETAYLVGMKDPYHFSRLFKRIMGISPKFYLKSGDKLSRSRFLHAEFANPPSK